jgi:hypothetical protein
MIGILLKPRIFIVKNLKNKYSLKKPFLIVSFISTLGGISGIIMMQKLLQNLTQNVNSIFIMGSWLGMFFGILGGVVIWAIITAFFHIPAVLMNGEGDYRKLLELIGYAQTPLIFSSTIILIVIASVTPDLSMEMIQDKVAVKQAFLRIPAFKVSKVFARLMLFWSLYLSFVAVREVHGLSNKKAALSVLVPVMLYVWFTELIKKWLGVG